MGKTLFLFLFSKQPDGYINAITHAYDRMQVDAVKLVYVKDIVTGLSPGEASEVANKIWNRLATLSETADIYKRVNERLLDREIKAIGYAELKSDLGDLARKAGGVRNCIVDLTGAAKGPSIDIFTVSLALGIESVYLFELQDPPDRRNPDGSLYHNLAEAQYRYNCLAATPPVTASRSSLIRKTPVLWAVSALALATILVSIALGAISGLDSQPFQVLNIAASVVGLASPVFALAMERHR